MAQKIKQANIFGRIGSGIGQGLAEQVPKEIERSRLAGGLQQFEKESSNLSPMQQLARLSAIPGITPQMIQSFGELGRQQAKGSALANAQNQQNQPRPSPFPKPESKVLTQGSEIPSITKEKPLEKIQEGYIPPTQDEIFEDAGRRYAENPALFGNDPNKAIEAAENAALREEKRNLAYQKQNEDLNKIQDNVVNRLRKHSENLGVTIPEKLYSKIEDKAIQSTKPKSEGGNGLTEQQAMKNYGKELDDISRDYEAIETLGNWGITGRKAKETLDKFNAIQRDFEKRNDTENLADTMIAKNKISPMLAYSIAQPISRVSELNKTLRNLPKLEANETLFESKVPEKILRNESLKAAKKLAPLLKGNEKASPLAIAYELEKRNYDSSIWLDYVNEHRDELGLTEAQGRQLKKPRNFIEPINDWWLSEWSGLE